MNADIDVKPSLNYIMQLYIVHVSTGYVTLRSANVFNSRELFVTFLAITIKWKGHVVAE